MICLIHMLRICGCSPCPSSSVVTTFTWFSRFPFPLPFNMYPLTWFAGLISLVHPRVWTFLLSRRPTSPLSSFLPLQLLLVAYLPPFSTSHPDDFTLESFTLLWSIFPFFKGLSSGFFFNFLSDSLAFSRFFLVLPSFFFFPLHFYCV